jgi:hypothetical protein
MHRRSNKMRKNVKKIKVNLKINALEDLIKNRMTWGHFKNDRSAKKILNMKLKGKHPREKLKL